MGSYRWGTAVAGVALTAAVVGTVSGCGGDADASSAKKKTAAPPSFAKASAQFEDALGNQCQSMEPDSCWSEMDALMKSARKLRAAMHGEKSVDTTFWSPAYALIDTMEDGIAQGSDLGVLRRARP